MDQYYITERTKYHYSKQSVRATTILKFMVAIFAYMVFGVIWRSDTVLAVLVIIMNVYCVIKSWKRDTLLIINAFILYSNISMFIYYWLPYLGLTPNRIYGWFTQFPDVMQEGLNILYIFSVAVFAMFPEVKDYKKGESLLKNSNKASNIMAIFMILGILLITAWKILDKINTGKFTGSSIYEYMSILFIMGFYHSEGNKKNSGILVSLLFLNVGFVFVSGQRMAAIQFILIFFAVYFQNKIARSILFCGALVGIIGLNAIGMWRGSYHFDMTVFLKSITDLITKKMALDTAYAAEASGLAMIKLAGDYSVFDRVLFLGKFLLAIPLGSSIVGTEAVLSEMTISSYPYHNGGGVLPNYGYFYLGISGAFLLGVVVSLYLKLVANTGCQSSDLRKIMSIYIFSTVASWYLYTPLPLFRGAMLLLIVYHLTTKFRFGYYK